MNPLRTLSLVAATAAPLFTPAAAQSSDYTWKPTVTACKTGTLASWLRTHGAKFLDGYEQLGPLLIGEITFANGKVQGAFVGPSGTRYCILALTAPLSGEPS